jgi:hypothetical protein
METTAGKTTRPKKGDQDLKKAAQAVVYEVKMLYQVAAIQPFLPLLSQVFMNMEVESFLVHFRNVRDFLYPTNTVKGANPTDRNYAQAQDTVIGFDFSSEWNFDSSDWTEIVPKERDRINKQLSHISYSRSHLDKNWPVSMMAKAIHEKFGKFLNSLTDDRRKLFGDLKPIFPDAFR